MKYIFTLILGFLCFTFSLSAQTQTVNTESIYIYGIGINLKDSTTYLTTPQLLEGVGFGKYDMLQNRIAYSTMLQIYLDRIAKGPFTCSIFYEKKKNKAEKDFVKIRRNLRKSIPAQKLIELPKSEFSFRLYEPPKK